MTSGTPTPDTIMLPNEWERRQIFYWLKRVSSYTAWNRILGYFRAWADIAEASVREAGDKGWIKTFDAEGRVNGGLLVTRTIEADPDFDGLVDGKPVHGLPAFTYTEYTGTAIPESEYRFILKGLAHMEDGVRRLRQGDKRVFQYNANGEFVMGNRAAHAWMTTLFRIEDHETIIDEEHTPHWNDFEEALRTLNDVKGECWPFIIETSDPRDPARIPYGEYLREHLPRMTFPNPLPEIPEPSENLLVPTGKTIPFSGIWEPVVAPKPTVSLFRKQAPARGPFPISGCMNYLHGGSPAPQASVETADDNIDVDTTWRLLWRDDRYEDGSIPAEEAEYAFVEPKASTPTSFADAPVPPDMVTAETGQPAPRAGRWLVENDLHASVTLDMGEPLPSHNGHAVRWVLAER